MINIDNSQLLLTFLNALSNHHRLKIIHSLSNGKKYVSELARELEMSRPLLYLHLQKLEEAEIITSQLEIMANGKAVNFISLNTFNINITNELIINVINKEKAKGDL